MSRYHILFYVYFLFTNSALAETREELDNRIRVKDGRRPLENSVPLETTKPGFYSKEEGTFNQKPMDSFLSSLAKGSIFYTNVIYLNFRCIEGALPIPVPYKFKNIKWNISKGEGFDVKGGTAQTDSDGKLWLNFKSKGALNGQVIKLDVAEKKIEIDLSHGPFEITLPMSFCKSTQ